jgi:hypothetical protein
MAARRRTILLAMLALAAPLPAFAISNSTGPVDAAPGPATISVSTSLASCGVLDAKVVCKLDVSFSTLANADSYSAAVTSADGSVVDYGSVPAGGTSFWVPYVGAGTYSVRITAYGAPETPSDAAATGNVIATGDSAALSDHAAVPPPAATHDNHTGASGADPATGANQNADSAGTATSDVTPAPETTTTPDCTTTPAPTVEPPPVAPIAPPPDTDPANPDDNGDGISDVDAQAAYEQQLAAYQAAIAAQQAPVAPAPPPGC